MQYFHKFGRIVHWRVCVPTIWVYKMNRQAS